MNPKKELQKQIIAYQRHLSVLKERQAKQGLETPPGVRLEIEDIETQIQSLQIELQNLPDDPIPEVEGVAPVKTGSSPAADETITPPKKEKVRQSVSKPPEHLIEEIAADNVIPVIGAGLSIGARRAGQSNPVMPSYLELLEILTNRAEKIGVAQEEINYIKYSLAKRDTRMVAKQLLDENVFGNGFFRELRQILNPIDENMEPSPAHNLLRTLGFRQIITTNYDRLLERFVAPSHEVITPVDNSAYQFFIDSLDRSSNEKFILKLHGDISRPETIFFGEEALTSLYEGGAGNDRKDEMQQFLLNLFKDKTFLFLGFSFESISEGYIKLLYRFLKGSNRPHYALVPHSVGDTVWRNQLTKETNIRFIEYHPDPDHSQVWEFISFLNVGKRNEPVEGSKWAQWYLPVQRHEYLERQLIFERTARSIRFLTPTLTNAIATDEHLDQNCRINFLDHPEVMQLMYQRRDNLEHGLRSGRLEVQTLFLKSSLDADFEKPDRVTLNRYRHLLDLAKDPKVDMEFRLISELTAADLKKREATFALIYRDSPMPLVDVAVAYASQATKDFFEIHMVEINTETVKEKCFLFERLWASGWSEQKSIAYIKQKLDNHL